MNFIDPKIVKIEPCWFERGKKTGVILYIQDFQSDEERDYITSKGKHYNCVERIVFDTEELKSMVRISESQYEQ